MVLSIINSCTTTKYIYFIFEGSFLCFETIFRYFKYRLMVKQLTHKIAVFDYGQLRKAAKVKDYNISINNYNKSINTNTKT